MEIIALILGFLYLQFDIALLKERSASVFTGTFKLTLPETVMWALFLALAVLVPQRGAEPGAVITIVILNFVMIYCLKRDQFFKRIAKEGAAPADDKLQLALSTFSVLWMWLLGACIMDIAVIAVLDILGQADDQLSAVLLTSEASAILLIILIFRVARQFKGFTFLEVMGLETRGLGFWKTWGLPAGFALVYATAANQYLTSRAFQPMTPLQEMINTVSSPVVLVFFIGAAILTAPFFEEVIFRGFFFYVIRPFKGLAFTVIFVALSFGLLHVEQYWGDWPAIAIVACFGLGLTLLRAWTGSAVPGMVSHYVYNLCFTVVPLVTILFSNPVYLDYQLNYYRISDLEKEMRLVRSIDEYPEFAPAYNDLAWLYAEQGIHLDRALELIDRALLKEPDSYAFLDTRAEVLFKMGRVREAVRIEEQLQKKYPNDKYLKDQVQKFRKALEDQRPKNSGQDLFPPDPSLKFI